MQRMDSKTARSHLLKCRPARHLSKVVQPDLATEAHRLPTQRGSGDQPPVLTRGRPLNRHGSAPVELRLDALHRTSQETSTFNRVAESIRATNKKASLAGAKDYESRSLSVSALGRVQPNGTLTASNQNLARGLVKFCAANNLTCEPQSSEAAFFQACKAAMVSPRSSAKVANERHMRRISAGSLTLWLAKPSN